MAPSCPNPDNNDQRFTNTLSPGEMRTAITGMTAAEMRGALAYLIGYTPDAAEAAIRMTHRQRTAKGLHSMETLPVALQVEADASTRHDGGRS